MFISIFLFFEINICFNIFLKKKPFPIFKNSNFKQSHLKNNKTKKEKVFFHRFFF